MYGSSGHRLVVGKRDVHITAHQDAVQIIPSELEENIAKGYAGFISRTEVIKPPPNAARNPTCPGRTPFLTLTIAY